MPEAALNRTVAPVVCAGIVVADHICTPIDHIPAEGELVAANDLILNIGGCASNAAMDLVRLGVPTALCGRVGNDIFGRFVSETLSAENVDVQSLKIDYQRPTSQTLIVNVRGQDRRFIHSFGANRGFSVSEIDEALSRHPRILYLGGYLVLPGLDPDLLAERFAHARKNGTITVLDVACPGPADYLSKLLPVLPHTDVFIPNWDEAHLILGEHDPVKQAQAFRDHGARTAIITQGDEGLVALSEETRVRMGVYPATFVDGTGGGDAFDAGYIAGLLDGLSELECLKLASAVGASCVRAVGTTAGVFTRAEADDFIRNHSISIQPIE